LASSPTPISFLSDFGLNDEFVGVVHGVIARLAPEVRVIDITHGIEQGAVRSGALSLLRAVQYLPDGVVLAVVDPGVGTARRAIALETVRGYFVGPDNGLLSPAVAMVGGATRCHALENSEFMIPSAGATFDGRDRFAPAAAMLASGQAALEDLGPEVDPAALTPMLLPLPEIEAGAVVGATWWIDHFGNVQTNVGPDDLASIGLGLGDQIAVTIGSTAHELRLVAAYGDVPTGNPMLIVDSQGLVALSVRDGRADQALQLAIGRPVTFQSAQAESS